MLLTKLYEVVYHRNVQWLHIQMHLCYCFVLSSLRNFNVQTHLFKYKKSIKNIFGSQILINHFPQFWPFRVKMMKSQKKILYRKTIQKIDKSQRKLSKGKFFSNSRFAFKNTFWNILNRFQPKKILQKCLTLPFSTILVNLGKND